MALTCGDTTMKDGRVSESQNNYSKPLLMKERTFQACPICQTYGTCLSYMLDDVTHRCNSHETKCLVTAGSYITSVHLFDQDG